MPAQGRQEAFGRHVDRVADLQPRPRLALHGVDRPLRRAGPEGQHDDAGPGEDLLRLAQPRLAPVRIGLGQARHVLRSEEHTSELQSLMRISYAVFCLKKKKKNTTTLQ